VRNNERKKNRRYGRPRGGEIRGEGSKKRRKKEEVRRGEGEKGKKMIAERTREKKS